MINIYDRDRSRLIVDPVNDPVTATASAVPIIQRHQQTSAHAVRIVQQRPVDELKRGKRHRLGRSLSQRPPNGGCHAQRETLRRVVTHAECRRRTAIDSANSSALTTSPRANSASESTKRRTVSGSDSTDKVSSIAELRKERGITQAALAQRAGISVRSLSKIEIGDRMLTPGIAGAIARALEISLGVLYGEVEVSADQSLLVEDLRAAVRRYDLPAQAPAPEPAQLRLEVDQAITLRDQADLASLLHALPGLLAQATIYAHAVAGPDGWALLASVYSLTFHLAARHRWMDLVEIVPNHQAWAAAQQPDPVVIALAARSRASVFLNSGDFAGGLIVVDRAIVTADAALSGPQKAFATGALHLRGMVLAGLLNDPTEAQRHIHAASTSAEEFRTDLKIHDQSFGPISTAATVLTTEADFGNFRQVIRLANEFTSKDTGLPPTRMVEVHVSTARAHLELGDRDSAQTSLMQAPAL